MIKQIVNFIGVLTLLGMGALMAYGISNSDPEVQDAAITAILLMP